MERLIIISNRLPISMSKDADGVWQYKMSSGGLVSALSGLSKRMSFIWVGWVGKEIPAQEQQGVRETLMKQYNCLPVFVEDDLAELYYNGFSNSILWPLMHYLPGEINFDESYWVAYQRANELFADAVADLIQENDIVWVQDYHLMLLPSLLRKNHSHIKIGWFLHTPFPSSEIYRILPVRKEVLLGVLSSDLIGFHTYDYARHFLSSCTRILGLSTVPNGVEFEGRLCHVGTFPIGIDPEKFSQAFTDPKILERIATLKEKFKGFKVLVGVDRLDYIKGVPQKLHALEVFLEKHPEFQENVVLVQVAVPSRTDVEEYQVLQSTVNELVGRINGKFGTIAYMPIHFMNKSVNFDELVALYTIADACLVSSTRDGMNLVSYEYILCQKENHGVLVLSEFAGAAQSLNGSIIINPWNTEELAQSIYDALTMSDTLKESNHQKLYRYVNKYTAAYWGLSFVDELNRVSKEVDQFAQLPVLRSSLLLQKFKESKGKRCVLIDYDGTLTTSTKIPEFAKPPERILNTLAALTKLPDTYVYILSGRGRDHLDKWFRNTGVGLSAEHGCFFKHPSKYEMSSSLTRQDSMAASTTGSEMSFEKVPDSNGWTRLVNQTDSSWREIIRPLFQHYTERTPGSFIEEKEINLTWHYKNADPEFGSWQAAELQVNLEKILSHLAVSIILGQKTLELRPSSVDKSTAVKAILKEIPGVDFVLCIGDGKTDEPVFNYLSANVENYVTATVGKKQTDAKYYVDSVSDVEQLLAALGSQNSQ